MPGKTPKRSAKIAKSDSKRSAAGRVASKATHATKAASKPHVKSPPRKTARPKLLSGGNPQITKADGDAPVRAYIAAMPGWKRDVGRRLDALIERTVPGVRKAVRWNTPFYGTPASGWFLAFHCFTKYVKVTFFAGTSLKPVPPVTSKNAGTRYVHISEDGQFDEELLASWIEQASRMPGWSSFNC